MFHLRDLPSPETIRQKTGRYPQLQPTAVEACLTMLRVASDVFAAFDAYLARHGMSQGRFAVLMLLNRNPETGMNPSDLAERAGVTRATMTGLLDGLERDKLVRRQPADQDRRMMTVHLTPEGQRFLDEHLPDYFRRVGDLMGQLTEGERQLLVGLLGKVRVGIPALSEQQNDQGRHEAAAL